MRYLVFGAGVLGGNLANNFFNAGKDVTLLARGDWAKTIRKRGLIISHHISKKTDITPVKVIETLEPDDIYDVIFVAVRYTQLDSAMAVLRENDSRNIVLIGNNVRCEHYASLLPGKNVMFAFTSSAGHRERTRIVSIDQKKITIGELNGKTNNQMFIREIFAGTRYKVTYEANMQDFLLCHAAFVIPACFAVYYADGDLLRLRKTNSYLNKVIDANIEGYRAIQKAGHEILPESDDDYESRKYRVIILGMLKVMCSTKLGELCASDHAMNAVDEMNALNHDMKEFFDAHDAEYPMWKKLERHTNGYISLK